VPQPAPIAAKAPPKAPPPAAPGAKPVKSSKSSIAQQALESVLGPPKTSPPPTTKSKKKLQLPYEANADSRAVALQKQQAVLARKQLRFRKAVPLSSGTLKSDEITISLAGLDALAADAQCTYESGNDWECGRWGKYALRRLIRGRTISCDVVERITENIVTASCDVAGVDINQWVVRRGWGRPSGEGDKKYDVALRAAKSDKLGQWSVEASVKQN
jgi:endonuclease YncB( thermonuclease family)